MGGIVTMMANHCAWKFLDVARGKVHLEIIFLVLKPRPEAKPSVAAKFCLATAFREEHPVLLLDPYFGWMVTKRKEAT